MCSRFNVQGQKRISQKFTVQLKVNNIVYIMKFSISFFLINPVHEKRQTEELLKGLTIDLFSLSGRGEDTIHLSV